MKKSVKLLSVIVVFVLLLTTVISVGPVSAAKTGDIAQTQANSYGLADNCQDGTILHAWNASYSSIKGNLRDIANAGYTSIQISPVQKPKDYNGSWTDWTGQWWKLYQPLSFSVANDGSWLGNKGEFQSLCTEAHKYGIKIICDIVANHTAGGTGYVDGSVGYYESQIYNNQGKYYHQPAIEYTNDNSVQMVVRGCIGLPDLNTGESHIQNRVISLLKECIDCGADGFRFDAAKHIETPDDGTYASQFWPNVIGTATSYASGKGKKLYCYGEILNTPGSGRSWDSYTKYMSITDNKTGNARTINVLKGNADGVKSANYNSGQSPEKLVLWGESHDTYANKDQGDMNLDDFHTRTHSQNAIDKSYCFSAGLKGSTVLYFVRPSGGMGSFNSSTYKASHVAAANKFHNFFIGCEQSTSSSGGFAICERYTSSSTGAIIVNCKGNSGSLQGVALNNMKDGVYKEMVKGTSVTVSNGKITSGNIGDSGVAVIYDPNSTTVITPTNTISQAGGNFTTDTLKLTLGLSNATSGTYQIDSQSKTTYTKTTTVTIGSGVSYGKTIKLTLTATDGSKTTTATYTFKKVDPNDTPFKFPTSRTVYLLDSAGWSGHNCYAWNENNEVSDNSSWPGISMTLAGDLDGVPVYSYNLPSGMDNLIFNDGDNSQTDNLVFTKSSYYDNKENKWVSVTPPSTTATTATTPTSATTATISTKPSGNYILGDFDLNGKVSINDATNIQKYLNGIGELTQASRTCGDCDGNGRISIVDATLIQGYLSGKNTGFKIGYVIGSDIPTASTTPTTPTVATTPTTATTPTVASDGFVLYVDMGYQCNAYAYAWNSDSDKNSSWPGVRMNQVSGSIYSVELDKKYSNIIFNDNGNNQTQDLNVPSSGMIYIKNSGSWKNYSGENPTTGPVNSDDYELYCDFGYDPGNAYAYYWNLSSGEKDAEWPGKQMEHVSGNIYKITVPKKYDMIIFNNGSDQTDDLSISGSGYIYDKNTKNWQKYSG